MDISSLNAPDHRRNTIKMKPSKYYMAVAGRKKLPMKDWSNIEKEFILAKDWAHTEGLE